ncbi:hypothetical protein SAMN05421541_111363 [Actinoplanes philippinensis]|uniref:Uncharacterized protein n=1 Tax=Actinoplanes philippinensis TaxID=35752 RepID=A0A1I2J527_9ACTN|nr:hypothetical protein SAMN05421541_111363 [Actinoplanes philippinensis]
MRWQRWPPSWHLDPLRSIAPRRPNPPQTGSAPPAPEPPSGTGRLRPGQGFADLSGSPAHPRPGPRAGPRRRGRPERQRVAHPACQPLPMAAKPSPGPTSRPPDCHGLSRNATCRSRTTGSCPQARGLLPPGPRTQREEGHLAATRSAGPTTWTSPATAGAPPPELRRSSRGRTPPDRGDRLPTTTKMAPSKESGGPPRVRRDEHLRWQPAVVRPQRRRPSSWTMVVAASGQKSDTLLCCPSRAAMQRSPPSSFPPWPSGTAYEQASDSRLTLWGATLALQPANPSQRR